MLDLPHPRGKAHRKKVVSRNPPNSPSLPEPSRHSIESRYSWIAHLCSSFILLRNLLLEQLILQLVRQSLRVLDAILLGNMDISFTSSSDVEVLSLHAGSQCYLGDSYLVFALCGLDSGRADIGSASSSGAECSIMMISDSSLADDFTISIAVGC
jgi:hypothetical protein